MAIGVLLSMISFVIVYAKLPSLSSSSLLLRSSTVVRSYEERCALLSRVNRGKIVTISLKGYVFFGSAVKILEEVKSRVILTTPTQTGTYAFSFGSCDLETSFVFVSSLIFHFICFIIFHYLFMNCCNLCRRYCNLFYIIF